MYTDVRETISRLKLLAESMKRWQIRANLGFVLRGPLDELDAASALLEKFVADADNDVVIAYKTASASRLWIKEDEE